MQAGDRGGTGGDEDAAPAPVGASAPVPRGRARRRRRAARLAALGRYGILDTAPEQGYDDIVMLASRLCEAPVALVSFLDLDRQWFKARTGFDACETPLSQAICAHALAAARACW